MKDAVSFLLNTAIEMALLSISKYSKWTNDEVLQKSHINLHEFQIHGLVQPLTHFVLTSTKIKILYCIINANLYCITTILVYIC